MLDGYYISAASGINNSGQVVGSSKDINGVTTAYIWDSINGMVSLGDLGGGSSTASAINNRGQVVGTSINSNGDAEAFVWDSIKWHERFGRFWR